MKPEDALSEEQRALVALARASPFSYGVRLVMSPGGNPRLVVVLGEAHLKLARAEILGQRLVDAFELRGVESFQARAVLAGRPLILLIGATRSMVRLLSFGLVKGSTITYARSRTKGHTALLEVTDRVPIGLHLGSLYLTIFFLVGLGGLIGRLLSAYGPAVETATEWLLLVSSALNVHLVFGMVPAWALRRHEWSWMLHPILAIVTVRDALMARGTIRMLAENPGPRAALVIMGRGHLGGFEDQLVRKYGFSVVKG